MTETVSHIALKRINGATKESFFRTLPSVSVSESLEGTLVIKAPYLQDAPLFTNDLVTCIDSTKFIWLGRLDNVINSGGVKLFPEQIELKLAAAFKNNLYYISKEKDNKFGEIPVLYIESEEEFELPDFKELVTKYEIPKKVYFLKEFKRTQTGKILRNSRK